MEAIQKNNFKITVAKSDGKEYNQYVIKNK